MAKVDLTIKTNEEALFAWDLNAPVWSCSMGGLGPGYEQCIQMVLFEMLRSMLQHPWPPPVEQPKMLDPRPIAVVTAEYEARKKEWKDYCDMIGKTPNVAAMISHVGLSITQFTAAFNMACVFAINGYEKAVEMIPEDRLIYVNKSFPTYPEAKAG